MGNVLLTVVASPGGNKKDGEAYTTAERTATAAAVLVKVQELGGVPTKGGKIDGGPFVAVVKEATKAVGPAKYAEKGRSWASLAFLAVSELKKLIAAEKSNEAKSA